MGAGPKGAVSQREDGLVVIDPTLAVGHPEIVSSCPYGAIYWDDELEFPQKCTGCAHLLDKGWKEPRCVDACPTGALQFGEDSELDLEGFSPLRADAASDAPRVFCRNIPKQFVAISGSRT
jgi:Fe-S-cluster-containing dehydrogenase component